MRITPAGVLLALAVAVVASVCVALGFWQLDRLEQRREFNAAVAASANLPPLVLDESGVVELRRAPDAFVYRRAVATGAFEPEGEVLLRGRADAGRPGVHLVAPFRTVAGDVILVNRGWIPAADGATVDPRPFRDTSVRRISGTLQALPAGVPDAVPLAIEIDDTAVATYRRLDYETLAAREPHLLAGVLLQAGPSAEGASPPIPVPPPALDEGPHLGYAIQWFSFAAIAVIGYAVLVYSNARRRPTSPSAV